MNLNKKRAYVAFALMAMVALSVSADGRNHYLNKLRQASGWSFYTDAGVGVPINTVLADKGCDVTTVDLANDNVGLSHEFDFNSWTVASTNVLTGSTGPWLDSNGSVRLRAGGLAIDANNKLSIGGKTDKVRVTLAESQTWSGPSSGTVFGYIALGLANPFGNYGLGRIVAENDMVWTLDGRIKVSFTASNDLSNVDIVVNPKARIILMSQLGNAYFFNQFLNAKSLTLKGGDAESADPQLTIGAQNPGSPLGTSYAPAAFDDATVSPNVYLVDGASVTGGTVDYGVSELSVSGGDSTFSGAVTLKKQVAIDVASGASLKFTGSVSADEGAGIALTGSGSLSFSDRLITVPISGDGTIALDPGSGEAVVGGDLSEFTGTIHAKSGAVLIHPDAHLNPGATLTAAEGAVCRVLTSGDFGDYSVDGKSFFRSSDGISHQFLYMDGFSGNVGFPSRTSFRETPDAEQSGSWVNGSVLAMDRRFGGGLEVDINAVFGGMLVTPDAEFAGTDYFDTHRRHMVIGERGFEFQRSGGATICFFCSGKLCLDGSQTWKGPAAETLSGSPARLNVGGNWNFYYPTGSMTPLEDGLELALAGDLEVHLYYPTNDMSTANVTVKSPAKLILEYPGAVSAYADKSGRLNAAQLTLDGANAAFNLGKNTEISSETVAGRFVLKDGAAFSSTGKTWSDVTLASAGTGGSISGSYVLQCETLNLDPGTGSTLDITGATFGRGSSVGVSATGAGTLKLSFDNLAMFGGPIEIDGPAIEISGSGTWTASLADASGLTIASSGTTYVTADALDGFSAGEIFVTSGVLLLDSVASLPTGCKVVTSGTGALALVDSTGFDADLYMGGTKAVASDLLIVTDEAVENETVSVADGQTLHVFGSGLKASSSVALAANSSIVFHRSATVASPVAVNGASKISTDADAQGVFSGAVTVSGGVCDLWADGGIVFEGGVSMTKTLRQRSGLVVFHKKNCSMTAGDGVYMYEGRCVISNCTFSNSNWAHWRLNLAGQTGDVVLEIASGGTLVAGNNGNLFIGGSTDYESRLLINGGTMTHATSDTLSINDSGNGRGVIEFASGTIVSQRRIQVGYKPGTSVGSAKFIWRGGVLKTGGNYPYRYQHLFESKNAQCGIELSIEGPDCVLDLAGFQHADSISNFNAGVSTMTGKPGAKLTVKGKSGVASKLTLANFTPDGMALDLNQTPNADVEIVGAGDALELGWVVPGSGGRVSCVGTSSPLLANYVAPGGVTFENSYVNGDWNSGFSSVTANDLVFWDGSTYLLRPTALGLTPLEIAGSVVASGTVRYAVDKSAATLPAGEGIAVVNAAEGSSGEGTWSAASATLGRRTRIYGDESGLRLDYDKQGALIVVF